MKRLLPITMLAIAVTSSSFAIGSPLLKVAETQSDRTEAGRFTPQGAQKYASIAARGPDGKFVAARRPDGTFTSAGAKAMVALPPAVKASVTTPAAARPVNRPLEAISHPGHVVYWIPAPEFLQQPAQPQRQGWFSRMKGMAGNLAGAIKQHLPFAQKQ